MKKIVFFIVVMLGMVACSTVNTENENDAVTTDSVAVDAEIVNDSIVIEESINEIDSLVENGELIVD